MDIVLVLVGAAITLAIIWSGKKKDEQPPIIIQPPVVEPPSREYKLLYGGGAITLTGDPNDRHLTIFPDGSIMFGSVELDGDLTGAYKWLDPVPSNPAIPLELKWDLIDGKEPTVRSYPKGKYGDIHLSSGHFILGNVQTESSIKVTIRDKNTRETQSRVYNFK